VTGVRGRRMALSHLRGVDDPAGHCVATSHAAHPRQPRHLGRPSTARRHRSIRLSRSTPLWVRSRATRGGPVPYSEGHRAPQRCQPGQNRRQRAYSRPSRRKSAAHGLERRALESPIRSQDDPVHSGQAVSDGGSLPLMVDVDNGCRQPPRRSCRVVYGTTGAVIAPSSNVPPLGAVVIMIPIASMSVKSTAP
jgi:hypothetical protein